jgi:hypothetical protein
MTSGEIRSLVRQEIVRQLACLVAKTLTQQDIAIRLNCHLTTFRRNKRRWNFPAPAIEFGNFIRWTPEQFSTWEQTRNGKKN